VIYTVTLNPSLDKYFVVDHLRSDTINRGAVREVVAGGKGINVSRFLKVFEIDSVILTFLGGYAGQAIADEIRSAGFSVVDFRSEGDTRENITLFNEENGEIYKLNEYGPTISTQELEKFLLKVGSLAGEEDVWVLAGSLPPGMNEGLYAELIEILQRKGSRVLIDTSGEALKEAAAASPDYIHLNAEELSEISGKAFSDHEAVAAAVHELMHKYFFKGLLCSLGEDGAMLAAEEKIYYIAAPDVRVVSTAGAGDAMVSAFLFASAEGYGWEETGKWAVAAGSIKVTVPGTGLFRKKEVQDKNRKITTIRMK